MGKTRTFVDKMKKDKATVRACPVCGAPQQAVRTLVPVANEETGYFKFRDKIEHVCKCNNDQVYG